MNLPMKISPTIILITFFAVTLFWLIINSRLWLNNSLFGILIVVFSVILSLQAVLTLFWMLYTWEDPEKARSYRSPRNLSVPAYSFTAFLPARHEEKVISDTIQAVNKIDYPNDLKEIIIICRNDDEETIKKAQTTIEKLKNPKDRKSV
ncbi:MAG: hypothetical protein M1514_02945, partial [Patescibacteria group bacterium]|nr:hypothetical protein [Patescibacteria group bacterium]